MYLLEYSSHDVNTILECFSQAYPEDFIGSTLSKTEPSAQSRLIVPDIILQDISVNLELAFTGPLHSDSSLRLSSSGFIFIATEARNEVGANRKARQRSRQETTSPRIIIPGNNAYNESNFSTRNTIVKLREGKGTPLIIIHGGYGSIHAFTTLQKKFVTPIWAIQVTPETPLHSLSAQAHYYYKAIKEEQPKGPYRISAFSASSLIGVAVVRYLEDNGDTVEQLIFIEHFPTTFITPVLGVDLSKVRINNPHARQEFIEACVNNLAAMTHRDKKGKDAKRHKMAEELKAAYQGLPISPFMTQSKTVLDKFLNQIFDFMLSLHDEAVRHGKGDEGGMGFMEDWLKMVRAPVSAYLGTYGMLGTYKPDNYPPAEWNIYGSYPNAKVTILDAGHYDILESDGLIRGLQEGYIVEQPSRARL